MCILNGRFIVRVVWEALITHQAFMGFSSLFHYDASKNSWTSTSRMRFTLQRTQMIASKGFYKALFAFPRCMTSSQACDKFGISGTTAPRKRGRPNGWTWTSTRNSARRTGLNLFEYAILVNTLCDKPQRHFVPHRTDIAQKWAIEGMDLVHAHLF